MNEIISKFVRWNYVPSYRLLKLQQASTSFFTPEQSQALMQLVMSANLTREQQENIVNAIETAHGNPNDVYKYILEMIRMFQQSNVQQEGVGEERQQNIQKVGPAEHVAILQYIQNNADIDEQGNIIGPKQQVSPVPPEVSNNTDYFFNLIDTMAVSEAAADRFRNAVMQMAEQGNVVSETGGLPSSLGKIPDSLKILASPEEQSRLVEELGKEGVPFSIDSPVGKFKNLFPIRFVSKESQLLRENYIDKMGLEKFFQVTNLDRKAVSTARWLYQKQGITIDPEVVKGMIISNLSTALSSYKRYNATTKKIVSFSDPRLEFFYRYPQYLPGDLKTSIGNTPPTREGQTERNQILLPRKEELFSILGNLISQQNEDVAEFAAQSAANKTMRDAIDERTKAESLDLGRPEEGRVTERGDIESGVAGAYGEETESEKGQKATVLRSYLTNVFGEVRQIGERVANFYRGTNQHTKADVVEAIIDTSVDQLEKVIDPSNEKMTKQLTNAGVVANYKADTGKLQLSTAKDIKVRGLVNKALLMQELDRLGREKLAKKKEIDRLSSLGEPDDTIATRLGIDPQEVASLKNQSGVSISSELITPNQQEMSWIMKEKGNLMLEVLDFSEKNPDLTAAQIAKEMSIKKGRMGGGTETRAEKSTHPELIFETRHVAELIEGTDDPNILNAKKNEIVEKYLQQDDPAFNEQFAQLANKQKRRRIERFLGDSFTQWAKELISMIPNTSDIARRIFLDMVDIHPAIKAANRPDFGWPVTREYYQLLGKEIPPEVDARVQEYMSQRAAKKKKASILYDIYKQAEKKIEDLKFIKRFLVKTASSFSVNVIDKQIQDVVSMSLARMRLYEEVQ